MTTYLIHAERIPEQVVPGKRLGRHQHFDSRSLAYLHPALAPQRTLADSYFTRHIPILDQGDLGSCTGNAETGALGIGPVWDGLPSGHATLNEAFAVKVYEAATKLDPYPGAYPPDDTGSDGQSATKAAQQMGLVSGYTHCLDIAALAAALQDGPVCIGINWYESFDTPTSSGHIAISPGAQVRGGHELVLRGVNVAGKLFRGDNSWSESWGDLGSFDIGWADMDRLFGEGGDAVVPTPLTQPAPTPTPPIPVPTPHPDDAADGLLAQVLLKQNTTGQAWVNQRHSGYVTAVANMGAEWLVARGYAGGTSTPNDFPG